MSTPSVSVVIPVHNRENLVVASVRSVLNQTWRDFELLVVDDASTDGSVAALEAIQDPRLRLIRRPVCGGAGSARNTGLNAARCEWVAFQDSDDEWLPDKLEKQMAARQPAPGAPPPVAVYTSYWRNGDGYPREVLPRPAPGLDGHILPKLCRGNFISTQTLMVRRTVALEIGAFDEKVSSMEDWDLAIRLAMRGPIRHVPEPLVEYRMLPDGLTAAADRFLRGYTYILEKHRALLASTKADLAWHQAVIGCRLCRIGNMRQGRSWLAHAWRTHPLSIHIMAAWMCAWLPQKLFERIMVTYGKR